MPGITGRAVRSQQTAQQGFFASRQRHGLPWSSLCQRVKAKTAVRMSFLAGHEPHNAKACNVMDCPEGNLPVT